MGLAPLEKFHVVRNALAHDYPDDPELWTSAINRFLEGAASLSALYRFISEYVGVHFPAVLAAGMT